MVANAAEILVPAVGRAWLRKLSPVGVSRPTSQMPCSSAQEKGAAHPLSLEGTARRHVIA
jgi:hypothetical protein